MYIPTFSQALLMSPLPPKATKAWNQSQLA